MPLTIAFKETVLARLDHDPQFAVAMLREGIDALLSGEPEIGREMLRDYINATMGFERLSKNVRIPAKSLMRMFGPEGNPQTKNLFAVIAELQRHAGIELHLAEISPPKKTRTKKRKSPRAPRTGSVRYPESSSAAHGGLREAGRAFKRR
jgi:DNA-binding phage protein